MKQDTTSPTSIDELKQAPLGRRRFECQKCSGWLLAIDYSPTRDALKIKCGTCGYRWEEMTSDKLALPKPEVL